MPTLDWLNRAEALPYPTTYRILQPVVEYGAPCRKLLAFAKQKQMEGKDG